MIRYDGFVLRPQDDPDQGNVAVGVSVAIRNKSTLALAPLFADEAGTLVKTNPLTTNDAGRYSFYAAAGDYIVDVEDGSASMVISLISTDELIEDIAAVDARVSAVESDVEALSDSLTDGSATVAGAKLSVTVANLKALASLTPVSNIQYNVLEYSIGTKLGGSGFYFDYTRSKSEHNGVLVFAPEALALWNGTTADLATLHNWTGTGNGCWVRLDYSHIGLEHCGATYYNPTTNIGLSASSAIAAARKAKVAIKLTKNTKYLITSAIDVYTGMVWIGDEGYSPEFYPNFSTSGVRMIRTPDDIHSNITLKGFTLVRKGNNAEHGALLDALNVADKDLQILSDGVALGGALGISAFYPENRPSKNVTARVLVEKGGNFGLQFGNVDTGAMELISLSSQREAIGIEPYTLGKLDFTSITSDQITWTAHGMDDGYPLLYSAQGNATISGLLNGRYYFVSVVDANTIKLCQSKEQALRNETLTLGSVTGTQRLYKCGIARNIQVKELSATTKDVVAGGSLTGSLIITATSGGWHENIRVEDAQSEQSNFTSGSHNIAIYGAHNTTISNCDLFGSTNSGSAVLVNRGFLVEVKDASGDISPSPALELLPDCVIDGCNVTGFDGVGIDVRYGRCVVKSNVVRSRLSGAVGIELSPEAEQSGSVAEFNRADVPNGFAFVLQQGRGNVDFNSRSQFNRINGRTQQTWLYTNVNLTTSAGVVCTLVGLTIGVLPAVNYSGTLYILAKNADAGNSETTRYVLNCAKGATGVAATITQIAANGLTSGGGASRPSFTWSIDASNHLVATPIASTDPNRTWHFWIEGYGDIEFA